MMKRYLLTLALLLAAGGPLFAQNDFRERFEQFGAGIRLDFDSYRNRCNAQYAEFLEHTWKSFHSVDAVQLPHDEMLPPVPYVAPDEDDVPSTQERPLPEPVLVLPPDVGPQPQPIEPLNLPAVAGERMLSFSFYGTEMKVRASEALVFRMDSFSEKDVAARWKGFQDSGYDNLLSDCLSLRNDHRLCDWAYLCMLDSMSQALLGQGSESELLVAYLFCQSGYRARIGRTGNGLCMLYGCDNIIFGKSRYVLDDGSYYVLNGEWKELYVASDCRFPGERNMSLNVYPPVLDNGNTVLRQRSAGDGALSVDCRVNSNVAAFYSQYPSSKYGDSEATRWAMYANAPLDEMTAQSIYGQLRPAVEGKDSFEAVSLLLDFVQTAFEYGLDNDVWGHDRAFFAEETLYYEYSDCEDRSILLSRLVRDLLGLDVALVYYPGHLATAVRFNRTVAGDCIHTDNGTYVICDPTYVGAPIGATMPGMDNGNATIILLK